MRCAALEVCESVVGFALMAQRLLKYNGEVQSIKLFTPSGSGNDTLFPPKSTNGAQMIFSRLSGYESFPLSSAGINRGNNAANTVHH